MAETSFPLFASPITRRRLILLKQSVSDVKPFCLRLKGIISLIRLSISPRYVVYDGGDSDGPVVFWLFGVFSLYSHSGAGHF